MAKYCRNCGKEIEDNATFCGNCGASQVDNAQQVPVQNVAPAAKVQNRNIVTDIILSLITCGIYGYFWVASMQNDTNLIANDGENTSGGMVVLLTLITCGIYGWIWYYKTGQRLFQAGQKYGKQINDNSMIYILLGIFGLGIVNYCLIQTDINKFSE